jgi:hypothetical protein
MKDKDGGFGLPAGFKFKTGDKYTPNHVLDALIHAGLGDTPQHQITPDQLRRALAGEILKSDKDRNQTMTKRPCVDCGVVTRRWLTSDRCVDCKRHKDARERIARNEAKREKEKIALQAAAPAR